MQHKKSKRSLKYQIKCLELDYCDLIVKQSVQVTREMRMESVSHRSFAPRMNL